MSFGSIVVAAGDPASSTPAQEDVSLPGKEGEDIPSTEEEGIRAESAPDSGAKTSSSKSESHELDDSQPNEAPVGAETGKFLPLSYLSFR